MSRATYCRCVVVQNYDYDEAAHKLRCKRRFLEDRISRLPHQKLGESVAFCDCELALIQRMFTVMPGAIDALITEPAPQAAGSPAVPALRTIRPAQGRTRAPAGV